MTPAKIHWDSFRDAVRQMSNCLFWVTEHHAPDRADPLMLQSNSLVAYYAPESTSCLANYT
jgi:hypothetical protein